MGKNGKYTAMYTHCLSAILFLSPATLKKMIFLCFEALKKIMFVHFSTTLVSVVKKFKINVMQNLLY